MSAPFPTIPRTVLHVDDDAATRAAVARMLSRAGHRVLSVADGAGAVRALQDPPDIVLLDVRLPDTTGFELCRHIRGTPATARLPVALLSSGYVADEDRSYAAALGADALLAQPVPPAQLLELVDRLTATRSPPDRPAAAPAPG